MAPSAQNAAQRLTIALSALAERLARLQPADLPEMPGVVWHLFVQGPPEAVAAEARRLARADLAVTALEGRGVARSRNAALAAVKTEFLLFADDDLQFCPEAIAALIPCFDARPEADFLCARLADEAGRPRKAYSPDGTPVRWFNGGKLGTPELALRPEAFRRAGVAFDPNFGAGQPDCIGDEYILLCDALRAGLKGWHVDLVLARHPAESSGTSWQGADRMQIRRRVLIRALGRWPSLPARLVFALRHRRAIGGLGAFLAFLRP